MRWLAPCALAMLAGCGGKVRDTGAPQPDPTSATSVASAGTGGGSTAGSGAGGFAGGDGSSRPRPIVCIVKGDAIDTSSLAALKQHILGQWAYCSGAELFAQQADGIEFTADYAWYFLQADATGALVRLHGPRGEGKWSFDDTSSMNGPGDFAYQLNLAIAEGGENYIFLKFAERPTSMRMNWMLGFTDYVAAN